MRRKLLNIDANAKTVKGQARGYMTAVLYLAPFKAAGVNLCPMAELAGCWKGCLNTAGRGGIAKGSATWSPAGIDLPDNAIQRARVARTRFYADDREGFMWQLAREIEAFIRKAERKGLTPVVRLNGTSDIQFEIGHPVGGSESIFARFPDVQFYDYTKIAKRFYRELPANYHLSLSYSEATPRYRELAQRTARETGCNLVAVVRTKGKKKAWIEAGPAPHAHDEIVRRDAIDGDDTDLRFTDPAGVLVLLYAKGAARSDDSGFVLD